VPDVAIYATAKKLVAPSMQEGFDALLCVRLSEPAFKVRGCRGGTRSDRARSWGQ
jgi:hypothetical protein